MNSRFFKLCRRLFQFAENVKCRRISLELISWRPHLSLERDRKVRPHLLTSSIQNEIRQFHVVVIGSDVKEMYKKRDARAIEVVVLPT